MKEVECKYCGEKAEERYVKVLICKGCNPEELSMYIKDIKVEIR